MTPVHLVWNSVCKCTHRGSWSIALFSQQGTTNCRNCRNITTCWEIHQRRKTFKDIKFFGKLYKCDTQAHCWALLETREEEHSDGHGSAEFYIRPTAGTLNSNKNYRDTYATKSGLKIQRSQLSHSHIVTHITKAAHSNVERHKCIINETLSHFIFIHQKLDVTSSPNPQIWKNPEDESTHWQARKITNC